MTGLILLILVALLAIVIVSMSVRIIPQAHGGVVERLGKYRTTLDAGPHLIVPFVDKVKYVLDMREQVESFPPRPVITEDNLEVSIDTVIYYRITDPVAATYEIGDYILAIEQLTSTTLRNIIGGMTLEHTLTSRDQINNSLRGELDGATGKWGIRVGRVELKAIEPPPSIKDAMEKQMRADRDKRAAILTAEGERQSQILLAEGHKQSAILTAEGDRQAQILRAQADRQASILRAQGEGQAIQTVFQSIHDGNPDQKLLAYQYLQMLPKISEGEGNTVWIVPAELTEAMGTVAGAIGKIPVDGGGNKTRVDINAPVGEESPLADETTQKAVEQALEAAKEASSPGVSPTAPPPAAPTQPTQPAPESGVDDGPAPQG